jgi:gluconolactonase
METSATTALILADSIKAVWQNRIDHAEGLAVDRDGTVWCGGEDGQIYRGRLDGEPVEIAQVSGRTLGFAVDGAGNAYCCTYLAGAGLYRITTAGAVDQVSAGTTDRPAVVPNQPAFLPSGQLLFTDSGAWGEDDGCIFGVDPPGRTTVADTTCSRFPNGLAVSPDESTLAVVETTLPGVSELSIGSDGSLHDRRVVVEMPGTVPDGVAYDETGALLIACWAPDAVFLFDDGRLSLVAQPTNLAFIPGTRRLATANYGDRFLSVMDLPRSGAAVPCPEFPWEP